MAGRATNDHAGSSLVDLLLERAIEGTGPLSGADSLASEYLSDHRYRDDDARVAALIGRETRKNFTSGFLTGLGGVVTFPVSIPAALGASWLIQARMAAAIAKIYGHDLASEPVRTKILLSLAGDVAKEAMKDLGLKVGDKLTQRAVDQIPGRALVEINKRIGARLAAKLGGQVVLRIPRAVPVLGGVVGGSLDAVVCRMVGRTANSLFRPPSGGVLTGQVVAGSGKLLGPAIGAGKSRTGSRMHRAVVSALICCTTSPALALDAVGALQDSKVSVVFTGDEEDPGSLFTLSRQVLLVAGQEGDIALGFEGGSPGVAAIGRRGIGTWRLECLDGLVAMGDKDHAPGEYLEIESLSLQIQRTALLAHRLTR